LKTESYRDAVQSVASEESETNVSEYAADSFNPRSIHIGNVRQHGITHAVIAPRSGGHSIFAGTGAVISLTGEFDSVIDPEAFVKRYADSADGGDVLSRQDAKAFARAVNGDIPLLIRVNRAADIMRLIDIKSKNRSLDMILIGAAESWEIADNIADANIRVIMDPLKNLPDSFESVGSRLDNVIFLEKAGVDYAISMTSRQKALRDRYNPLTDDERSYKYR